MISNQIVRRYVMFFLTATLYLAFFLFSAMIALAFFATALDGFWNKESMATVIGFACGVLFGYAARVPLRAFSTELSRLNPTAGTET